MEMVGTISKGKMKHGFPTSERCVYSVVVRGIKVKVCQDQVIDDCNSHYGDSTWFNV